PGGEGLAVVPLHVLPEEEDELPVAVLPGPALGELGDDGVHAMGGLERVEEHEVAEARHGRPHRGDGRALMDGEALGQVLAQAEGERAARAGRLAQSGRGQTRGENQRYQENESRSQETLSPHEARGGTGSRAPLTGRR